MDAGLKAELVKAGKLIEAIEGARSEAPGRAADAARLPNAAQRELLRSCLLAMFPGAVEVRALVTVGGRVRLEPLYESFNEGKGTDHGVEDEDEEQVEA